MDLDELMKRQQEFDAAHGWLPGEEPVEVVEYLRTDLIGLIGEAGEFANIVKKIHLRSRLGNLAGELEARSPELREELVDCLVYLLRLAGHLKVDLEAELLAKMRVNRERFHVFETSAPEKK